MTKYCCFIWTQWPAVFWPKYGPNEEQVCRLLLVYVNDKSLVTQEEIDCALCWRQGPVTIYLLKVKGKRKVTSKEKEKWDPFYCLPSPPYAPGAENPPHGEDPQAMVPQEETNPRMILGQI
jgi:hypothetical protein